MLLSCQLYSARNVDRPYAETVRHLAETGYDAVEIFFGNFEEIDAIADVCRSTGISVPTAHIPLDLLESDSERVVSLCRQLGIGTIFAPFLPPDARPTTAEGWRSLAARLAAIQEIVAPKGFAFGWHNHDFEITPLPDGTAPMQIILDEAPKIEWEADIAWIVRGGGDPLDWIERYGRRITAAHFKDIAPKGDKLDEDGWADPGTGTLDWPAIASALKAGTNCACLVAEHDNPSDFDRFARQAAKVGKDLK